MQCIRNCDKCMNVTQNSFIKIYFDSFGLLKHLVVVYNRTVKYVRRMGSIASSFLFFVHTCHDVMYCWVLAIDA